MKGGSGKIKEEMKEAEEEIEEDDAAEGPRLRMVPLEDMEEGHTPGIVAEHGPEGQKEALAGESNAQSSARKPRTSCAEGARNFCSLFLGPVFVQAFVLTFLGEWGDRSQIATIALGAAHVCTPLLRRVLCMRTQFSLISERVHCRSRNGHWTLMLYSTSGGWGTLCLHQDICKTRFVSPSPSMPRWILR